MKYICNTTCWVAGKKKAMYMPGDIVDFTEDEIVPGHFTCIEPKPIEEIKVVEEVKKEEMIISSPMVEIEEDKGEIKPKLMRRPTLSKE